MKKLTEIKITGIPLPIYLLITIIVFVMMRLEWLPSGMIGAFAIMMVFGGLFNVVGNNLPIVKTYLGGGAITCIFVSATLVYCNVIPESVVTNVKDFMNVTGFLNFYIAALITGSILGMDRSLLLKAAVRFLPVALIAMTFAILAVGTVGAIINYGGNGNGFVEAIMYVAIPMMGGGMGAGVVPLSGMYAESLIASDPSTALTVEEMSEVVISRMIPASTLGNVMAIVGAGLVAKLGETIPSISGDGRLMRNHQSDDMNEKEKAKLSIENLGIGIITGITFFLLGTIVNKFISSVHTYAWMIIFVAVFKAIGIVPEKFEIASQQWSQFVSGNWTSALLVGIGIGMIDLGAVIEAISPLYLLLVFIVVSFVALGAAVGGHLVGFYPVEASITAGLCTTNMGGTGDIAVLSASKRMELLPFAQIATRICGALVLIVASILVQVLL